MFFNFFKKKEVPQAQTATTLTLDDLATKNFKKEEWYKTKTGLDNIPKPSAIACLFHTSRKMQAIREAINLPIIIESAYRSQAVNKAVKGSPNSKHMQGLACDFNISGKTPEEGGKLVAKTCKENNISFDKILIENGCVHIQFEIRDEDNQNFVGFAELVNGDWVVKQA
jgi:zinc D-Ala-D-Ala carboxypeptidase